MPDGAGGEMPLQRLLAQKLAERLRVNADEFLGDDALHQVVCRDVQRGGRRRSLVFIRAYPWSKTLPLLFPLRPEVVRRVEREADPDEDEAHRAFA